MFVCHLCSVLLTYWLQVDACGIRFPNGSVTIGKSRQTLTVSLVVGDSSMVTVPLELFLKTLKGPFGGSNLRCTLEELRKTRLPGLYVCQFCLAFSCLLSYCWHL